MITATMTDENVAVLQGTLDRLTAKIDRWEQKRWCDLNGVIDAPTEADLESLRYHDFELTPEFVEMFRELDPWLRDLHPLPVADCGTSFCVAGDICVSNGYTFMGTTDEWAVSRVIKTENVGEFMAQKHASVSMLEAAPDVARELLGLGDWSARALFAGHRSLPEIWGVAYALSDGRITLPETLPDSQRTSKLTGCRVEVPGTEDARNTRVTVFEALKLVAEDVGHPVWVKLAVTELALTASATT